MKLSVSRFTNIPIRAVLGVSLCALLIVFGGPYLGIGVHQPLAGVGARVVAVAGLAAIWSGVLAVIHWRAIKHSEAMGQALAAQDASGDVDARVRAERLALRQRFLDATNVLRKASRGKRGVQALPWYLVIGAPGSGKSTFLEHSGLAFPVADSAGNRAVAGIGGTRQCDWWFTDRAVFLDTAGRYTTQDSDPGVDAPAWHAFLELLRRHRGRRPVNGVILTVSVAELLTMDADGRRVLASSMRQRLDELGTRLGVALPVYLVLTKIDLVTGFLEAVDTFDAAARAQVWGVSFPEERSIDGSAPSMLTDEFDALLERVDAGTIERMHTERDVRRRARLLSFPQQLRHLRELAVPLAHAVFGAHAYGRAPVLRGMYLTSGTQEGTPIDRVLSVVSRAFGMRPGSTAHPRSPRRTFFIERLVRDVILQEAGFAGVDPRAVRRRRLVWAATVIGIVGVTAAMVLGMATSAARNADHIARIDEALRAYPNGVGTGVPTTFRQYNTDALQRLETLGRAEQIAATVRANRPWSMRFGLFQGDALYDEVRAAHLREVNAALVPGLVLQFRNGFADAASNPQRLYDILKGYLMLSEPGHRDGNVLTALACARWREVFPDEDGVAEELAGHFRLLFEGKDALRTFSADAHLVDAARASLRAADVATLVYGGLKLGVNPEQDAPVRLDRTLGLLGNVFRRRSGASLAKPLPALYTRPVFARLMADGSASGTRGDGDIATAVDRFLKDDWVFGVGPADPPGRAALAARVKALYVADYIRAWDGLINDLELQPVDSVQAASGVAGRLAAPGSPLKALLMLVRDNTTALLRDAAAAPIVEHFAPINQLTDGAPGATPLDRVLGLLDQASKALLMTRPGADTAGQPDPALAMAREEARQLPAPLSAWLASLVGQSESLVSKGADGAVADGLRQAGGGDCARFVSGRYPFAPDSQSDIPLQNFGELFGNGGRFDTFFRQTLSHAVDTSGPTWTFRSASGTQAGGAVLAGAQQADAIRQAYFQDGPAPKVAFSLSVSVPPVGISRLLVEMDGQRLEYTAGAVAAPVMMQWPGTGAAGSSVSAWDTSGRPLPVLRFPGAWGFFHMLDAASLQRRSDTRFAMTFVFGPGRATVDLEAASLHNPFADGVARRFRCPS